ncbi:MAG: YcxB family protein [Bacteroidetes bacterium]|nr:YcxB family protein [Bacteroidota bacterium]
MVIHFGYDKKQVLQALRYHFITRPEIKTLLIVVNIFTIISAVLLYMHKIQPLSFLVFSLLWFLLIITVWKFLPNSIYKKNETFRDSFSMDINHTEVVLNTNRGTHAWQWKDFSTFTESPYFFHLYFNSRAFFLVPKDAFEGILELQAVRQLLREKIGKK